MVDSLRSRFRLEGLAITSIADQVTGWTAAAGLTK